jgi:hypothetical protein
MECNRSKAWGPMRRLRLRTAVSSSISSSHHILEYFLVFPSSPPLVSEPGLITQSVRPSSALTVVGRSVKVGRRTVVTRTRTLAFVDTPGHSVETRVRVLIASS